MKKNKTDIVSAVLLMFFFVIFILHWEASNDKFKNIDTATAPTASEICNKNNGVLVDNTCVITII